MGDELRELERAVDTLDAARARRVARLVVECRASLRDALAAVQLADSAPEEGEAREVGGRWFGRLRARHGEQPRMR